MAKQTFTTGQVLTAAQMTSLQQTAMGGGAATAKTASYVLTAADAGTVVQMNAAGATTITVNTALFAAGDSVQIQNIGAGVCTITAGTATVTTAGSLALSQWEGGNLYFTSTSASIFFDIVQTSGMTNPMTTTGDMVYSSSGSTPARLGIGSTGQVVTVAGGIPSWATPSSGGMTLLSTTTLSGASTTISSISQDYVNLFIVCKRISVGTAGGYLKVGCNGNTTNTHYITYKEGNGTTFTNANSALLPCGTNQPNAGYSQSGTILIGNYADTQAFLTKPLTVQFNTYSGTTEGTPFCAGYWDGIEITSLKFEYSNGATISGTVKIYGVK
jgi:hypothetical protein